jgi:predicted ATPase
VHQAGGLFCTGKYDLLTSNRNEPCTAFVSAFEDLQGQIALQGDEYVQQIKERVEASLGEDVRILLDLVPSLSHLFGDEQQGVRSSEAPLVENRSSQLLYIFRNFVRAVSSEKNPLVVVIDDIQWADPSSLFLIECLVTDTESSSFLLVITCRSNEVHEIHTVPLLLASLQRQNVPLQEIFLDNLNPAHVHSLVNTVLRSDDDASTMDLADTIHQKTHGNPFYVLTFIQTLVDEALLDYNFGKMRFTWNLAAIRTKNATENVAVLVTAKLKKLDPEKQTTLQVAACLSQSFERSTLAFVVEGLKSSDDFKDAPCPKRLCKLLESLATDGVLEVRPTDPKNPTYLFVHDQIQAAALMLVPFKKREALQLAIGQRLIEGMDDSKVDKYLFLAVDLCNSGIHLLEDEDAVHYAHWNLMAGDLALRKAAWSSALKYLETGIKCLGPGGWENQSRVALSLRCGAVEAAYCLGDLDKMESYAEEVLDRDEFSAQDKIRVHLARISAFGAQERFEEAVDMGRQVLKETGMADLPKAPSLLMVIKELVKTQRLMKGHNRETIMALPTCDDPTRIMAMGIINQLSTMAYTANPNFFLIMFLKSLRWTIKYGVAPFSPVAISTYGVILCSVCQDAKQGLMLGETALALAESRNWRSQRATIMSAFFGYVHHWLNPLRDCIVPLAYGYKVGMESGEVEIAFICIANHDTACLLAASKPLPELVRDIEAHNTSMQQHKQEAVQSFLAAIWQVALNLIGPCEHPTKLTGKAMNERNIRRIAKEKNNRWLEALMDYWRFQLSYLFGHYEEAAEIAETTMDIGVKVGQSSQHVPRHSFMVGMVAAALAVRGTTKKIRRKNQKLATSMVKRLQSWVSAGNGNCVHMARLLDAEIAAAKLNNRSAEELYQSAIAAASRSGYLNDQALAHERAAVYFIETYKNDHYWAAYHLGNAVHCYREWGAETKVAQLLKEYGTVMQQNNGEERAVDARPLPVSES